MLLYLILFDYLILKLAIFLWLKAPVLMWLYLLAVVGLIADGIAVIKGKHKSRVNEIVGFAVICLAAPLAYSVTTGSLSGEAMAMWILNTLFFSSAVYTIKLRRKKTAAWQPGLIYHCVATFAIASLYYLDYLSLVTALSFAVALLKLLTVFSFRQWYRKAKFRAIAIFETRFALLYIASQRVVGVPPIVATDEGAIASVSVLPAHLPSR